MLVDRETGEKIVLDLLRRRQFADVKWELLALQPADIVDLFGDISVRDRVLVFRLLPKDLAVEVFEELEAGDQRLLLEAFSDEYIAEILDEMSPDDRAELFDEMPAMVTARLMTLISPSERAATARLLGYREGTAGRIMTPEYIRLRADMTAEEALRRIRAVGLTKETVYYSYITDPYRRLLGVVSLRSLVLADARTPVSELMSTDVIAAATDEDREQVADLLSRYDLLAVPVIDREGRLVGIVTGDDAADIIEEEATEDFHKGAAVSPLRSYREASAWSLYRKRIGWLVILVLVNLISSSVIAAYEEVLAATIALAFFIPLLIDSGGNTGAQSATLMVRAIATGDVDMAHWFRVMLKEVGVGVALGITMGLASSILGIFRGGPIIGLIVGLSMVSIVLVANLIGAVLPFILTRLRLDPAVASSPLITTIADASGLFIYFTIAVWMLGGGA